MLKRIGAVSLLLSFVAAIAVAGDYGYQQPFLNITGMNQIDGVSVNPNTAGAGNFTTLSASGAVTGTVVGTTTSQTLTNKTIVGGTISSAAIVGPPAIACGATCTIGGANAGNYTRLDTAAGSVATLPAATNQGTTYKFYVSVATTSNAHKILTNPITDTIIGTAIGENAGTAKVFVGNAGTFHSIQMPFAGTQPSGGFIGDTIVCTDVASGIWKCDITYQAGTTPTTPYSASTT